MKELCEQLIQKSQYNAVINYDNTVKSFVRDIYSEELFLHEFSQNPYSFGWYKMGDKANTFLIFNSETHIWWWYDREGSTAVKHEHNPLYCSCSKPHIVMRETVYNKFKFCTICRKEQL